jgi:plastocyanin
MPDDDTTTVEDRPDATAAPEAVTEPRALPPGPDPVREARRTRLIFPILLPLGAAVMIAVFVLNVSRILLAAGSTGALVMAIALIVVILGGAAGISAAPRLRTSSLVMLVSGLFIVLISAGLVATPNSVEKTSTVAAGNGFVNPKGAPIATLGVIAFPTLHFQANQFTVPAGIIKLTYTSMGGNHTLAFDDPRYSSVLLMAPGGPTSVNVLLKPGSYVIFCTIPGHRAAGMQATIIAH